MSVLHTYFKQTAEDCNKHDHVHAKYINSAVSSQTTATYCNRDYKKKTLL